MGKRIGVAGDTVIGIFVFAARSSEGGRHVSFAWSGHVKVAELSQSVGRECDSGAGRGFREAALLFLVNTQGWDRGKD